ncbi:Protein SERAC1 [Cytospora mali]|uniref:Protein SERAC1 n=1 Tax=Cytospora mali TaxID=578113 RepID=A0A194WAJ2_CYTMA|nr:Protein SERAC1 [Valsa mali]
MKAQRPIIFVAHSLGGIVIKEFLHVASNTGHDDLSSCVCGILFLGTPHRGSYTASFMDVVSGVLKPLLGRPANTVIKDLSSNSRHLQELDQLLRFRLAKIDIYSFYELLPMSPMKEPIVERHSALLNIPSEIEQIGLEANHRQMYKPPDRNHFIYETITQRIVSVMNKQIDKEQYTNDLMEMTNKLAEKQMEHTLELTKELHESQTYPNATPVVAIFQQTLSFHVNRTMEPVPPQTNGFEELLKSLPTHKVKILVDGIQKLMDRAKSLQDLLLETERQNERRKAQSRIEAERMIVAQKVQELQRENSHLKAALSQGTDGHAGPQHPQVPQFGHFLQQSPSIPEPLPASDDGLRSFDLPQPIHRNDQTPCGAGSPVVVRAMKRAPPYRMFVDKLRHSPEMDNSLELISSPQSLLGSQQPGLHQVHTGQDTSPYTNQQAQHRQEVPVGVDVDASSRKRGGNHRVADPDAMKEVAELRPAPPRGRKRQAASMEIPSPSKPWGLMSTALPGADQATVLTENRKQMRLIVGNLNGMMQLWQRILESGEPALDSSET